MRGGSVTRGLTKHIDGVSFQKAKNTGGEHWRASRQWHSKPPVAQQDFDASFLVERKEQFNEIDASRQCYRRCARRRIDHRHRRNDRWIAKELEMESCVHGR